MTKVCANCIHWDEWEIIYPGWGECEITHGYGKAPTNGQKAWATDNDDYHAVLMTAPDFGCNQFKARAQLD